jgi:hypothetical protein
MQSSRGDTPALSLLCDERHESLYFEFRQAGKRSHISRKPDRLRWRLIMFRVHRVAQRLAVVCTTGGVLARSHRVCEQHEITQRLRHTGLETPAIRYATQQQRDWRRDLSAYDTSARLYIKYIENYLKWRESVPLVMTLQLSIGYGICSPQFWRVRRVRCCGQSINVDESVLFNSR